VEGFTEATSKAGCATAANAASHAGLAIGRDLVQRRRA